MVTDLRKTTIICTLGPATEHRIEELFNAGMNVGRINFHMEVKKKINLKLRNLKR